LLFQQLIAQNLLVNFCKQNNFSQNIIFISYNTALNNTCNIPLNILINQIRNVTQNTMVYIILEDDLSNKGIKQFCNQNALKDSNIKVISNNNLYQWLISKTHKTPNISVVSNDGEILMIRKLNSDLSDFFTNLPLYTFKIYLKNKKTITNHYVKNITDTYINFIDLGNSFLLYHPGLNMLAKYSKDGDEISNYFLDSLKLDYFKLAEKIFSKDDFENTLKIYRKDENIRKMPLINASSVFKFNDTIIGVLYSLTCLKDTTYKKDSVYYEKNYHFVVLLDTQYHLKKVLIFNDGGNYIASSAQSIVIDSILYVFKYLPDIRKFSIASYVVKNDTLKLNKFIVEQHNFSRNKFIPTITSHNKKIFVIYNPKDNKSLIYQIDVHLNSFEKVFSTNNFFVSDVLYSTNKNNFIFLLNRNNKLSIKGYIPKLKKFIELDNKVIENQESPRYYFIFSNTIHEVSVIE
jgi:TusA-related sulfurtransferase